MTQSEKSKQFFLNYWGALSGKAKTYELITQFVADPRLIEHILFFEKLFPQYEAVVDEIMAEGNRVFVRSHIKGRHAGTTDGIPATNKKINVPFALGYQIENDKIVDFWAIANEMELFEQLGLARDEVEVSKK